MLHDIKDTLEFTKQIAVKTGKMTLKATAKGFKVNFKGVNNLVTDVDLAAEKMIVAAIEKRFPTHNILGEEGGQKAKKSDYDWIIDPIDGTTNFAHGHPYYAVSIALYYKSKPLIGVVYAPYLRELFWASKGGGAYLNGKKIAVSKTAQLTSNMSCTGFPPLKREENLPYLTKMLAVAQAIRRCGAATIDFCYIACGRYDTFWELGLHPWDIAAGRLIMEEAGGKLTQIDGSAINPFAKQNILATNKKLHPAVLELFDSKDLSK